MNLFNQKVSPIYETKTDLCIICLSPLNSKRNIHLECLHRFHVDCLHEWFRFKKNCPCCRTKQISAVLLINYLKRNRSNLQLISEYVSRFILKKKHVY